MENFLKSHKPMSFVLAFVVMSLLAITAYSFMNYAEAFQGLIVVLGAFAITYTIFWFQSGRVWLQLVALTVVSALAFGFAQLVSPTMTIPVLSGIIAAGMIEIIFEVLFGFIANNIRAADKAEIAKIENDAWERVNELKAELAQKTGDKTAPQAAAPKQAAPANTQPSVSQNKLIVWLVGLVFSSIAKKEDQENDTEMKLTFARSLVEAIVSVFNLQMVKNQNGGVRKILTETLQSGYSAWLKSITTVVSDEEEAHFAINDGKNVIYLAVKQNEVKPTPVVDEAIAAETQAQAKTEPKKQEAQAPAAQGQKSQGTKPQFRANRQVGNNHKAT